MDNWNIEQIDVIIIVLNRTVDSVTRKAGRLGLDMYKNHDCKLKRPWLKEEDTFLTESYKNLSAGELAGKIDRTITEVTKRPAVV